MKTACLVDGKVDVRLFEGDLVNHLSEKKHWGPLCAECAQVAVDAFFAALKPKPAPSSSSTELGAPAAEHTSTTSTA